MSPESYGAGPGRLNDYYLDGVGIVRIFFSVRTETINNNIKRYYLDGEIGEFK